MLSFLPRWDYCWKSEFDTDVKIENYYHPDGEQLGFNKKSIYQIAEQKAIYYNKLQSREHHMTYSIER